MFPNPQDALPLPARPHLERYKKIAKALVKACTTPDPAAIGKWTDAWVRDLTELSQLQITPRLPVQIERWIDQVEDFARRRLSGEKTGRKCVLADAQFVIARAHGFESWPKFARHVEHLERRGSAGARFEAAADAIVAGDLDALEKLLHDDPQLIRARSSREHGATLLHYVSANGVEGYRQKTPQNIVAIATVLLDAGADVNAECRAYGGGDTTLGLAATSVHPERAGVQEQLLQLLLDRGARMERPGGSIVDDCLANGRLLAARYLAERGAGVDLTAAAALSRLEDVKALLQREADPKQSILRDQWNAAFRYACMYGSTAMVEFFVRAGVDLAGHGGDGQTGLHYAAIGGKLETVKLLLRHQAPLEIKNKYGGTVMGQALWSAAHGGNPATYAAIIEALLESDAKLCESHPPINPQIDALLLRHGSRPDPTLAWFGERPQQRPG
jgi:ankyrin repeat protein